MIVSSYLYTVVAFVIVNGFNFLSQIYLASRISPDVFGAVATAMAYVVVATSVTQFQGDKYLITSDNIQKEIGAVFVFELIIGFASFIFVSTLIYMSNHEESFYLYLSSLILILSPVLSRGRVLQESNMNFRNIRFVQVINTILSFIIILILVEYNIIDDFFAVILFRYLSLMLESIYFSKYLFSHLEALKISWSFARKFITTNTGLWLGGCIVVIYTNIDYMLLNVANVEKTEVGYYWMAFTFLSLVVKFRNSINEVVLPHARKIQGGGEESDFYNKGMNNLYILYSLPFLSLFICGDSIFSLFLGDNWLRAYKITLILMVAAFLKGCFSITDIFFIVKRKNNIFFKLSIVYLVLLLIVGLLLSFFYGVIGMACAVVISTALVSVASTIYCYKESFNISKYLFFIILAAVYMLLIVSLEEPNIFYRIVLCLPVLSSLYMGYKVRLI